MSTEYVLRTQNLTKTYGRHNAVDNVSMNVRKGDIYGLIGKNGAGKTTFLKMVAGLANPTQGTIELFGKKDTRTGRTKTDWFRKSGVELQQKRIGCLVEEPGYYPGMTALDNLEIVRRNLGITEKDITKKMLEFVKLSDAGKKKVRNFSMGMKQRLGIAVSLIRNPDFLVLDEPINGLDPSGIKEIRDLMITLNRERQITILISSHILGELSKIATRYGIIRDGALVEEFDAEALEDRCKRCQKVVVDDTARAAKILEERFGIRNYDVPDEHVIRIFERYDEAERINSAFVMGGVALRESMLVGQDLEGYFMDLLGSDIRTGSGL
ncbi:MAG: ATP-binding cassette domain-containing protein [Lachnospiraceae bacterium]|nr:ATP-binding cassette domain-containing protein [Lachnospiraceae bacterium]